MPSDKWIRIGFIGAGSICRDQHLPRLARIPEAKVVAVCNRSRASSQKVADDFAIPKIEEDWRKLIQRADLDAVFIGTWPYMHRQMSQAVLEAGKHCFCQARMCMDLAEAKAMVQTARAHPKLVNMICPPPTRMPFEPYIRKVLAEGALGDITAVELISRGPANINPSRITWRERIEFSGRQVLAMGIYAETLNAILGDYDALAAQIATPISTKKDEAGKDYRIQIPQVVTIAGRLTNGALITEQHMGLTNDSSTPLNRLTIWGLKGTLQYDFGNTIKLARDGGALSDVNVPSDLKRPWQVEQDFVHAVLAAREGKPWQVSPDFEEGLRYMKKVEAVHLSAQSGTMIKLAEL